MLGEASAHVSKGFQDLADGLSSNAFVETTVDPATGQLDYTNVTKNLSVFESLTEEPTLFNALLGRQGGVKKSADVITSVDELNNNDDAGCDEFRYQNITTENLGYTGIGVDVKPYGIAK
jgi:hypothetical protein